MGQRYNSQTMWMNDRQRQLAADKVVDLGHVIFGALVIGQFVGQEPWRWALFACGLLLQVGTYTIAFLLSRRS